VDRVTHLGYQLENYSACGTMSDQAGELWILRRKPLRPSVVSPTYLSAVATTVDAVRHARDCIKGTREEEVQRFELKYRFVRDGATGWNLGLGVDSIPDLQHTPEAL
jgi:hypothetical protein